MTLKKHHLAIAALLIVVLGAAAYYLLKVKKTDVPAPAAAAPALAPIELLAADVGMLLPVALAQTVSANGSVKPLKQAVVKSQVSAMVFSVTVQEGDAVKAGTLLATTDAQDYQSRVAAQQAAVAQAQAQIAIAQRTVDNNKSLVEKGFISPSAFDVAVQQLDANKAALAAAQANLAVSQKALQDTQIRAPIAGIVTEKLVAEGDKVSPDMKLFTITAPGAVEFEGSLPAADAAQVKQGQAVIIQVEGMPTVRSTITRINSAVTAGTRNVNVYAPIKPVASGSGNADYRAGSFANAKVLLKSSTALAVPAAALREEQGRSVVYTLSGSPFTLQSTTVTAGLRGEDEAGNALVVVEGLPQGQRYITRNLGPLRVGSTVNVGK